MWEREYGNKRGSHYPIKNIAFVSSPVIPRFLREQCSNQDIGYYNVCNTTEDTQILIKIFLIRKGYDAK